MNDSLSLTRSLSTPLTGTEEVSKALQTTCVKGVREVCTDVKPEIQNAIAKVNYLRK